MRIQYFNGGLANQVFQYIFYRYAQLSSPNPEEWFLDDSFFFFKKQHNGYELEKVFGVKPNLLSKQFEGDAWNYLVENRKNGIGMAENLANLGFHVSLIAEAQNYKTDNPYSGPVYPIPCNEYHPEILQFKDEIVYYFGYWINKNWLYQYKDQLMEELTFPALQDEMNIAYASKIKSTLSVGVHVRRGDYLSLGVEMDAVYYEQSVRNILKTHPKATLFVFSDEPDWCEEHADELGFSLSRETIFIRGNVAGRNYIDMQLLGMCKGMIMSNSAFCYLAALLSNSLEFFTNPTPWREL
ncbi:MAG: alpha-1,2-fucosyltransferase [Lachnospiraceae bacterium]